MDLGQPAEPVLVRRVRADEWRVARDLRLDALQDEAAPIAFLETHARAAAQADDFYRDRTRTAAVGDEVAQLVAVAGSGWVGSVTVIVQPAGSVDHHERTIEHARASVVGVYVRPEQRGTGVVDRLLDAAAKWAREQGFDSLRLDVHGANHRAQAAYRRAGFVPSGDEFVGSIGRELEMVRPL